jgi:NADH dehydrogenase (ubiquinone) 1 beta subcomplex subunit 4
MAERDSLKTFDPRSMYDVTREERRAMQERAALRDALREEYRRKVTNPHRGVGGYVFDPAVQRFLSMRANHYEQFRPAPKNAAFGFVFMVAPFLFFWWKFQKDKDDLEHKCRTGQIAYKDRNWKYI